MNKSLHNFKILLYISNRFFVYRCPNCSHKYCESEKRSIIICPKCGVDCEEIDFTDLLIEYVSKRKIDDVYLAKYKKWREAKIWR